MMKLNYRMVYFDLDGTLLDFARSEREALTAVFSTHGVFLTEKEIETYVEINKKWWKFFSEGRFSKEEIVVARFKEFISLLGRSDLNAQEISWQYLRKLSQTAHFLPGAEAFLERMKAFGFRMAVLSNGVQMVQENRAKLLKLERFFEFILTSEVAGKPKPDPTMFFVASSKSGVPLKESVYVGDDPIIDFLAAKNAGTDFILIDLDQLQADFEGNKARSYGELFNLLTRDSIQS
ncbi:MAG: YjjG family noncanonical pyrimidine nucleotidase [Pseudothermotoga sp.]